MFINVPQKEKTFIYISVAKKTSRRMPSQLRMDIFKAQKSAEAGVDSVRDAPKTWGGCGFRVNVRRMQRVVKNHATPQKKMTTCRLLVAVVPNLVVWSDFEKNRRQIAVGDDMFPDALPVHHTFSPLGRTPIQVLDFWSTKSQESREYGLMCMIYDYDAYGTCMCTYTSLQGGKKTCSEV